MRPVSPVQENDDEPCPMSLRVKLRVTNAFGGEGQEWLAVTMSRLLQPVNQEALAEAGITEADRGQLLQLPTDQAWSEHC